jgi:hypothetical protein
MRKKIPKRQGRKRAKFPSAISVTQTPQPSNIYGEFKLERVGK